MAMQISERRQWFRDRIEKTVYRNHNGCNCPVCQDVVSEGLRIDNLMHADYLYDIETESTGEGYPLRYFDTQEEVKEFVASIRTKEETV